MEHIDLVACEISEDSVELIQTYFLMTAEQHGGAQSPLAQLSAHVLASSTLCVVQSFTSGI